MKRALCLMLGLLMLAPFHAVAEDKPELPDTSGGELKDAPPASGEAKDVATPSEDPEALKQKITHQKPARFRVSNLLIGALGGAIFGSGIAVLFFSRNEADGSLDQEKMKTSVPIGGGGGAAIGGLVGFLLGATTPTGPKPPDMEGALHLPVMGPQVALTIEF